MSDKIRILVTGSNGQLGMELRDIAPLYSQYEFFFTTRDDMPIDRVRRVGDFFDANSPQYCINCAAYTAVDKAEEDDETENVFDVNAEAVDFLADMCDEHGTKLVHISTDYVFDGQSSQPYKETDPTHPINAYGASKLMGENYILEDTDAIIIRTSWVYSSYGKNFVKTMVKLMGEKNELKVVNDQVGSPTYAADLASTIMKIISSGNWQGGIYHYSNDGEISWFDFATAIQELSSANCFVRPIPTSEYPTRAARPLYSVLDKTKIQQVFNVQLKDWKDSLSVCLQKIKAAGSLIS